jgi:CRP-like cAMP-binding protein
MPQPPQIARVSQNRLLAAIAPEELARLAPHFQRVRLVFKETLFETGERIEFFYFPLNGAIAMIASTGNGRSVGVGIVGREGAADVSVVLGDDISSHRGIVQIAGSALKLSAGALKEELRRDGRNSILRSVCFAIVASC